MRKIAFISVLFFCITFVNHAQELLIAFTAFHEKINYITPCFASYGIPCYGSFAVVNQDRFPKIKNILLEHYINNKGNGSSTAIFDTVTTIINTLLAEKLPENIKVVTIVLVTDGEENYYTNKRKDDEMTKIKKFITEASVAVPVAVKLVVIEARNSIEKYHAPNRSGLKELQALSVCNDGRFYQLPDLENPASELNQTLDSIAHSGNNAIHFCMDTSVSLEASTKEKISGFVETALTRIFPPNGLIFMPGIKNFRIGDDNYGDSYPAHSVDIDDFYVSPCPVTEREFWELMDPAKAGRYRSEKPITCSWNQAVEYCNKRSLNEKKTPVYTIGPDGKISIDYSANGYRLIAETEWEYCASQTVLSVEYAVFEKDELPPVKSVRPNANGLYFFQGIREWTNDYNLPYTDGIQNIAYQTGSSNEMITRGAAYIESLNNLRITRRSYNHADFQNNGFIGFRVVCPANK